MARIITKGLIGLEDMNLGNSTFSRATSTGGTQVLHQINSTNLVSQATPIDKLVQGANIVSALLFAVVNAGMYKVDAYAVVSRAATTSSTLPSIVIGWTDADTSVVQSFTLTPADSSNLLTSIQAGFLVVNAKAGTNITYSTTGYASVGATSMQYSAHVRVEGPI